MENWRSRQGVDNTRQKFTAKLILVLYPQKKATGASSTNEDLEAIPCLMFFVDAVSTISFLLVFETIEIHGKHGTNLHGNDFPHLLHFYSCIFLFVHLFCLHMLQLSQFPLSLKIYI
jgi:hypothetical protein